MATWTVSSRTQPLSGHAASSSTSRPLRGVKSNPRNQEVQQPVVQTKKIEVIRLLSATSDFITKRQHIHCVLSVPATSRARVKCAAIAFPRICFCVREGSDGSRGETPRFADGNFQPFVNFCPKAWSVHSSEPAHDNERSCARQLISAVPRRQLDATRHKEARRHMYTQTCTQKDSDRDTIRETWKETLGHFR